MRAAPCPNPSLLTLLRHVETGGQGERHEAERSRVGNVQSACKGVKMQVRRVG